MQKTLPNGKWRKRLKIKALPPFAELHKVRAGNCKIFNQNYFRSDGVVCAGGNSSKMVMNGGQINGNIYVCRTSITNYNQVSYGSAVHVLPSGEFVMNGGEICNNVGFRAGAITIDGSKRADFNGGTISGNQSKEETGYSVMIAEVRGNPPVGDFIIHENMIVDGAVWLNDYNTKLTNAGTINGSVYMKRGAWDEKTGAQLVNTGTITGNIELEGSPYGQSNAAHLVNTGTVNGVVTLLGHGATISSSQELDIKSGSPDYMVLKESVDGTVTYTLGEVNEPVLNRTSADLVIGNTLALTTIIMPKDEADAGKTVVLNSKVVWSSNNESVATVDENGNVTAISEGIAIISAKVGNDIVFCSISVSTPYYPSYIPTFTPTYPTGGTGNGGTTGGTTITDPDTPLDDGTTITDEETPLVRNPLLFRDVPEDMWCRDAVAYVFDKGLMKGISDTVFAPAASTERGMIVTILHRLEGEPTAAASSFTDVAAGKWYTDAIAWGAANGVVEGYSDTIFKPTQDITREQLAAILFRYAQLKGYDTSKRADLSAYTDAGEISAYALEAMRWAVAEELISGVTSYTLVPSGRADRAQVATILMRFCENIVPA